MQMQKLSRSYTISLARFTKKRARLGVNVKDAEEALKISRQALERSKWPNWIDKLIKPIARELSVEFPNHEMSILGPFGLCCEVSIYFMAKNPDKSKDKYERPNCFSVTFISGNLDKGELLVRAVMRDTNTYKPGSVGQINGMNHPSVKIPKNAGRKWFLKWVN